MALIVLLIAFIANVVYSIYVDYRKEQLYINQRREWAREREYYAQERQQLLDRIQAGSFAEYKTQEVRVIKAQVIEKETPRLEQL